MASAITRARDHGVCCEEEEEEAFRPHDAHRYAAVIDREGERFSYIYAAAAAKTD